MLKAISKLILAAIFLAPLPASAQDGLSGQGELECIIATYHFTTNCDVSPESSPRLQIVRPTSQPNITVGPLASATITVEWVANSPDAEVLYLGIGGNSACVVLEPHEESCYLQYVHGTSPLSVTLYGEGASNTKLKATIYGPHLCHNEGPCVIPPEKPTDAVRAIRDQVYTYTWTLVGAS